MHCTQIANTPRITHGHVIPIIPVSPARGLFASPAWTTCRLVAEGEYALDAVVYNSLTVDPSSDLSSPRLLRY